MLANGGWPSFFKPQTTGYIRVCKRRNGKNVMCLPAPHLLEMHKGPIANGLTMEHLCRDAAASTATIWKRRRCGKT